MLVQWLTSEFRATLLRLAINLGLRPRPEPAEPPAEQMPEIDCDLPAEVAIENMLTDLFKKEGGYANHPADRGKQTKYGITIGTLSAWRKRTCTEEDVKALKTSEARQIYLQEYFYGPRINELPYGIRAHVFDIGVNSGPGEAIRMLQRTLNAMGADLVEDGIIGPKTLAAARYRNPDQINKRLVQERLAFYDAIVRRRPDQVVFLKNWRARARCFLAEQK